VHVATTDENGTVGKLSTLSQQLSTTRVLPSIGNRVEVTSLCLDQLTTLLVLQLLPVDSLGYEFSSQGHFHSLELLNVPQFLFCQVVKLKTTPRGDFSHP